MITKKKKKKKENITNLPFIPLWKEIRDAFQDKYITLLNPIDIDMNDEIYQLDKGTFGKLCIEKPKSLKDSYIIRICLEIYDNTDNTISSYVIWRDTKWNEYLHNPNEDTFKYTNEDLHNNWETAWDFLNTNCGKADELDNIGEKLNLIENNTSDMHPVLIEILQFCGVMGIINVILLLPMSFFIFIDNDTLGMIEGISALYSLIPGFISIFFNFFRKKKRLRLWKQTDAFITSYVKNLENNNYPNISGLLENKSQPIINKNVIGELLIKNNDTKTIITDFRAS